MRDGTPAEEAEAAARAKFFEVMRANPRKSEAEIMALLDARNTEVEEVRK